MFNKYSYFHIFTKCCYLDHLLPQIACPGDAHNFVAGVFEAFYSNYVDMIEKHYLSINIQHNDVKIFDWVNGKGRISFLLKKSDFIILNCDLKTLATDSSSEQSTQILG